MVDVKVFKAYRYNHDTEELVHAVSERGVPVYVEPLEADVSIVISGYCENPAILHGKKVIAFDATEWFKSAPVPKGWSLVAEVIEKYYDDGLNLTHMDVEQKADAIVEYVKSYEAEQPGS